ncbi:MAG: cysteine dioxygenase [Planctomycetes bacterium]|nr:cysteine dioxygenase [Planctomycetota bacterium]
MTPPIPSQSLPGLPDMVERCRVALQGEPTPEEAVERLVPILRDLIAAGGEPDDFDCSDAGYTRHLIHEQQDPPFSLYTMVWRPGQWTPVHDHGAWGIVGVLEGELHEESFCPASACGDASPGLRCHARVTLSPGSVVGFTAPPDLVHRSGSPEQGKRTVSLHLYGAEMGSFHVYDCETGERTPHDAEQISHV